MGRCFPVENECRMVLQSPWLQDMRKDRVTQLEMGLRSHMRHCSSAVSYP